MDFNKTINRWHTGCVKYDGLQQNYGRSDLLPLWVADMDFEVCPAITDALRHRLEHQVFGYSIAPDSYWQSIQDWLLNRHRFSVERDELTFIPGIVRGLAMALQVFTNKGDKVLIQQPVYHPFRIIIEGNCRKVVRNPLRFCDDGHVEMDFELLERQFAEERPRMMILCNPHNPGGFVWSREELARLADLCTEYGVLVASDEIHGDLELFGNRYTPFASVSDAAAQCSVTFGAPSKTFNIAGIVSSWCVVKNPALRRKFFTWLTVNEYNVPTFVQTVATEAAYTKAAGWLDEALRYIEDNIRYTEQFLAERIPQIRAMRPQASFLVWLDCSALGLKGKDLVDLFVDKAHLALNDGEMFGTGGECHMRLNVGCCRTTLEKALRQLEDAVNKNLKKG